MNVLKDYPSGVYRIKGSALEEVIGISFQVCGGQRGPGGRWRGEQRRGQRAAWRGREAPEAESASTSAEGSARRTYLNLKLYVDFNSINVDNIFFAVF